MIPMMTLLQTMSVEQLKEAAHDLMPLIQEITRRRPAGSG
jgi:hypothetical protein